MIVFRWLKTYFELNEQKFKQMTIDFSDLLNQENDKPSQFVDIFGEMQSARVSLWETGECDFEIIDNDTSKNIFWENQIIETFDELNEFLNYGFSKL